MSASNYPKTCCSWDCALFNGCRQGGMKCETCGKYYCAEEMHEEGLCVDCYENWQAELEAEEAAFEAAEGGM